MTGRRFAVLVGAAAYQYYRPLRYSGADAAGFGSALARYLGFSRDTMLVLADPTAGESDEECLPPDLPPTRNAIYHAFGLLSNPKSDFYARKQTAPISDEDVFVFYFSGHGVRTTDGDELLLSTDASDQSVVDTAVNLSSLVKLMTRLPCRHKVLFIDACRSELDEDEGGKSAHSGAGVGKFRIDREGIATFYSCDPRYRSYEIDDDDIRHGSFTYCLLEAVRDAGVNTLGELNSYLASRVPTLNAERGKLPQQPFFVPNPADMQGLPLFKLLEQRVDLDDLMDKLDGAYADGRINYELWDRVSTFFEEAKEGRDTRLSLRQALVDHFVSGELTEERFLNRWERTERATAPVREREPQARPRSDFRPPDASSAGGDH